MRRQAEHHHSVGQGGPRGDLGALGTVLLVGGIGLLVLSLLERTGALPIALPRFWYINRPLWFAVGVLAAIAGAALLRGCSQSADLPPPRAKWRASRPGRRFRDAIFYTRQGCHLCEDAHTLLSDYTDYLPDFRIVDIDTDPQLAERFGQCVPVVELDGKVRFRGRVPEVLLRRLIEGTAPIESAHLSETSGV